jgi:hypothetical protein
MISLGRKCWGQSAKELTAARGQSGATVSYPSREGIRLRMEDSELARRNEGIDTYLVVDSQP